MSDHDTRGFLKKNISYSLYHPERCSLALNLPCSSCYRWKKETLQKTQLQRRGRRPPGYSLRITGEPITDTEIISVIASYREDKFYQVEGGCKILSHYLRRDHGIIVNHKKIYRLCREHGMLLRRKQARKLHLSVQTAKNHLVTRSNQVWEFDVKYCWIHGEKQFGFLTAFIDVYTRQIKAWGLSRSCRSEDVLRVLKLALSQVQISHRKELFIRSDNGTQMRARYWVSQIQEIPSLVHEYIPPRSPNENAHIESFFCYSKYPHGTSLFYGLS